MKPAQIDLGGVKWTACEWSGAGHDGAYAKIWFREARTEKAAEVEHSPFGWAVFDNKGLFLSSRAHGDAKTWQEAAEAAAKCIAAVAKEKP